MALTIADRVKETSTTTGSSNFTLAGAVTGYRTFSAAIGNNTTYYCIQNQTVPSEWEVGFGTISGGTTLVRTEVIASSNSNSAVNFSAGSKDVFCTHSADTDMLVDPSICEGRLTLSTGTPVPSTDVNSSAFYFTPYMGNRISVYNGNRWRTFTFAEKTKAIIPVVFASQSCTTTNTSPTVTTASTANYYVGLCITGIGIPTDTTVISITNATTFVISNNATTSATNTLTLYHANYDAFIYDAGNNTLTLSYLEWTNNTTRANALGTQDGIRVLNSDATHRYLGTFRIIGFTTLGTDSVTQRFMRNENNVVNRRLFTCPGYNDNNTNTTWTTTSTTLERANSGTASRVEYISGPDEPINLQGFFVGNAPSSGYFIGGISIDSITTAKSACQVGNPSHSGSCSVMDQPAEGYHSSDLLVLTSTGTTTFSADFARLGGTADPRTTYLEGFTRG